MSMPEPERVHGDGPGCLHAGCGTFVGLMVGAAVARVIKLGLGVNAEEIIVLSMIAFAVCGGVLKGRLWRRLGL